MFRLFLTTLFLTITVNAVQAQPSFQSVKFTHSLFGPERAPAVTYRQDEICLHYTVTGLQTDADNHINLNVEYKLLDPQGAVALRNNNFTKTDLLLGGATVPGFFTLPLDFPYLPEGEWTVEVTATDNHAKRSTTVSRKWTHKPRDFAMVKFAFARDDQFKVPARLSAAVVGQPIFVRNKMVGFTRDQGKMELDLSMTILNAEGKEVLKASEFPCRHQLEGPPTPVEWWDFTGNFVPNRPGDFVIRLVAHDRIGKKTATVEIPLHVENP